MVSDKLCKELQANRIAGLFLDRPCKNVNVSPLGLCPKKEKGKFQLIFHLSYPQGDSVNDFVSPEFSTIQYIQIANAIKGIKQFTSPCFF